MKNIFLQPCKLILLLMAAIPQISCAKNTIEPYFPGLSAGAAVSEHCSKFHEYSIHLIEQEGDQLFSLFKSPDCTGEKRYDLTLGIEATLAGIWQEFLVFDEGTDVNGHSLRLVSLTNAEEVYILEFEGEAPRFGSNKITYFAPTEKEATAQQCSSIGINYQEVSDNSAGVLIGEKYEFSTETKKPIDIKGQYTCYAVQ